MKKVYLSIFAVLILVLGFITSSFLLNKETSYAMETSGRVIAEDGEIREFSSGAKYISKWLGSKQMIEDGKNRYVIDKARLLYLDTDDMLLLGKSVAIPDLETLIDLPSRTTIKEGNRYDAYADGGIEEALPKGSIVKLAEGRYLILDSSSLKNAGDLNKKLASNALVIKDSDDKIIIVDQDSTEVLAADDVQLEFDHSIYTFDLETEMLILDDKNYLNLKNIKVDMNDDADKFIAPEKDSDSEQSQDASSIEEAMNQSESDSNSETDNSVDASTIETEATNDSLSNEADNSDGKNSNTENGEEGTEVESIANEDGETEEHQEGEETNQLEQSNLEDVVGKVNDVTEGPGDIPQIYANISVPDASAVFEVFINDVSTYLTDSQLKIYDTDGNEVSSTKLNTTSKRQRIAVEGLNYGQTYQAVIDGGYRSKTGDTQSAIFFREIFTMKDLELNLSIIENTGDTVKIKISSDSDLSGLTDIKGNYKKNTVLENSLIEAKINLSELINTQETIVTLSGLESNTSYVFQLTEVTIFEMTMTDNRWVSVFSTAKERASIKDLEAEYLASRGTANVTPIGLVDEDDSLDKIHYKLYDSDEYLISGEEATIINERIVSDNNVYLPSELFVSSVPEGNYIVVAYLIGFDGFEDYEIFGCKSTIIKIGLKEKPIAEFELSTIYADGIDFEYLISDMDEALIFEDGYENFLGVYLVRNNIPVGDAISEIKINSRDDLTRDYAHLNELKANDDYIILAKMSYQLDDNLGTVTEIIGMSEIFTTLDTEEIIMGFALENVEQTFAYIEVSTTSNLNRIDFLEIGIFDTNTGILLKAIDLSNQIEDLQKNPIEIMVSDLVSNREYTVRGIVAKDSGGNESEIIGNLDFFTKKQAPQADTVFAEYEIEDKLISAIAGQTTTNEPILDEDIAISKIEYTLYEEGDEKSPLETMTVTEKFGDKCWFTLFERGKKYVVHAEVTWFDNYTESTFTVKSKSIIAKKEKPEVDISIVERTSKFLAIVVNVEDEDDAIIQESLHAKIGDEKETKKLSAGLNELEFYVDAENINLEISGEYELVVGEGKEAINLERLIRKMDINSFETNSTINAKEKQLIISHTSNQSAQEKMLLKDEKVKHGDELLLNQTVRKSDGLFTNSTIDLPTKDVWFNNKYSIDIDTKYYFSDNQINNTIKNKTVVIGSSNSNVDVSKGKTISFGENPEVYEWSIGAEDPEGNIWGNYFENKKENKYLGASGTSITDEYNSAQTINLLKQKDGSYVMAVGSSYFNFTSGTTTTEIENATTVDLFLVSSQEFKSSSDVETPELKKPEITINMETIGSNMIRLGVDSTDVDVTWVAVNGVSKMEFTIVEVSSGEVVRNVDYTGLSAQTIAGLNSSTLYELTATFYYDLLDNEGEQKSTVETIQFETLPIKPTLGNISIDWYADRDQRYIEGTFALSDPDKIITKTVTYLYELPEGIQVSRDPEIMAERLASYQPIAETNQTGGFKFNMFEGSTQLYETNKQYVTLTKVVTNSVYGDFYITTNNVVVSHPRSIRWSMEVSDLNQLVFTYDNIQGYLIGEPSTIEYEITNSRTGIVTSTGDFQLTNKSGSVTIPVNLDLRENYSVTLKSKYNLLDGTGEKEWSASTSISTSFDDIKVNNFTASYKDNQLSLNVNNLEKLNNINVGKIYLELYEVLNLGSSAQKYRYISKVEVLNLNQWPYSFEGRFDLSTEESGYYISRLAVEYTDSENSGRIFEQWSLPVEHTTNKKLTGLDITTEADQFSIGIDTKKVIEDTETYKVLLKNQFGAVVAEKETSGEELKSKVQLSKKEIQEQFTIQVVDEEGQILASETHAKDTSQTLNISEKLLK